jgi:Alpha amylase, catalytic domain
VTPRASSSGRPIALRAHPHLYEINTWAWLEKLSARLKRTVTLAEVPDTEWDSLARLGFDAIWLMGVWRRSPEGRRIALANASTSSGAAQYDRALNGWKPNDVIASPYAVAEYAPDPRIGAWQSIDDVRAKLHARGMALFLDFVGNHTALDHRWTREHPEFYVNGTAEDFQRDPVSFCKIETPRRVFYLALGRDPYFPPWPDVAQLNHFSPQMRAAQLAELRTIASHCDGVRCDMAMLHLNDIFGRIWGNYVRGAAAPEQEFWQKAHAAVPELILLAEAYWGTESRLLELGFSYVYDKGLYDAVRDRNMADVHARLGATVAFQSHLARFLENHDEERCAAVFGRERLVSVASLMGTLPGMRFYHQGELEGASVHLPISLRVGGEEPPDPAATSFFAKLLRITKDAVFHEGDWNLLSVTAEGDDTAGNLAVYEWKAEKTWKVVAVNLAGAASQGRVHFGDRQWSAREYVFYDELNDERYVRSAEELGGAGLFVRREGNQAHLFNVTPA